MKGKKPKTGKEITIRHERTMRRIRIFSYATCSLLILLYLADIILKGFTLDRLAIIIADCGIMMWTYITSLTEAIVTLTCFFGKDQERLIDAMLYAMDDKVVSKVKTEIEVPYMDETVKMKMIKYEVRFDCIYSAYLFGHVQGSMAGNPQQFFDWLNQPSTANPSL